MSDEREVWCLFEAGGNPFPVVASPNTSIGVLKNKIKELHKNNSLLQRVDPSNLILWKSKVVISMRPSNSLAQRIRNLGSVVSQFEELDTLDTVSDVLQPQTPNSLHLDILVQIPASTPQDEYSFKRRRLAEDPNPSWLEEFRAAGPDNSAYVKLQQFWKSLWQDQEDLFREVSVHRDPNPVEDVDVPATMKVLRLPKIFSSIGDIMIRDDYDEAVRDIEILHTSENPPENVIIVGHPGIGKTTLLYYILAKRLLEQKPTILQNSPRVLFFFNANGVEVLNPSSFVDPELEAYRNTWALVDINADVQTPAEMLRKDNSPFFLVIASSPKASRWQVVEKYRGPATFWLMKPFTLPELIQARQLQRVNHKESDIENFFGMYGPSARDCYNYCTASALNRYDSEVRRKVKQMDWDSLTNILTSQPGEIEMDQGSHSVLLVEPDPGNRAVSRTRIVTKTVSQLLWERDSNELWRNHLQLFRTLRLEPNAKGLSGMLFEPAFHALCVPGATFTIYPMRVCQGGPVNYKFTNDQPVNLESLILGLQNRVRFKKENQIDSLLAGHYYQPTSSNHPSYDSFVYDPVSRRISAFQVTVGESHDLKPKGVRALHELGQRLQINDLKIRIIVVVFGNDQVTYTVAKELHSSLGFEVYALEVTEDQLYNRDS